MRTSGDHRLLKMASLSLFGGAETLYFGPVLWSCTLYTMLRVSCFAQHSEVMEYENTTALADSFSLAESRLGLPRPVCSLHSQPPFTHIQLGFLLKYHSTLS